MANTLGIITLVVLLAAGFVAYKTKDALENVEIPRARDAKSKLEATKATLVKTIDEKAATVQKNEATEAEIATLAEDESNKKKANEDIKGQIDAKTAKVQSNTEKLDDIRSKTSSAGNLTELADEMSTMNSRLEEVSMEITSKEATLAGLTAENKSVEAKNETLKSRLDDLTSGRSVSSMQTRIRSIYPGWGFVTLAAGNNAGIASGSTLDVIRDGTAIAKLLVTSVESSSASASIIPDSMAEDTTLMVGDRVVPGVNEEAKEDTATAAQTAPAGS